MSPDWPRLFPLEDYRFPMGLRRGNVAAFWHPQDGSGQMVKERQRWLEKDRQHYVAELAEAAPILQEARAWVQKITTQCEPDWAVLSSGLEGDVDPVLLGGEVVFPSGWSLPAKLGQPLESVHGPVPGLQTALGKSISAFLRRVEVGSAWERENWGLGADAELNHHPSRLLPGLTARASLADTWIRLERQFLTRLPVSKTILFGIRVSHHRLEEVARLPGIAAGIIRALETMPDAVAEYKGLLEARVGLVQELQLTVPDASGSGL